MAVTGVHGTEQKRCAYGFRALDESLAQGGERTERPVVVASESRGVRELRKLRSRQRGE
jgi:hypothetical protein